MKMYSYWETSLSYLEQRANNNIYLDNIDWTDYVQMYGKKYHSYVYNRNGRFLFI